MLLLLPRGRLVEVGDGGGEAAYITEMKWNVMDKKTKNYDNSTIVNRDRICMVVKENDKCKRVEILATCDLHKEIQESPRQEDVDCTRVTSSKYANQVVKSTHLKRIPGNLRVALNCSLARMKLTVSSSTEAASFFRSFSSGRRQGTAEA